MEQEEIGALIKIREDLILRYQRCRDYKNNKNAIMKEIEHAEALFTTIKSLDEVLKKYVEFK